LFRSSGSTGHRGLVRNAWRADIGALALMTVIAVALGRAVAFILAPGQAHELPSAIPLLDRLLGVPKWVVAGRGKMDRPLEWLLARAGQLESAVKPILEINLRHDLIVPLANLGEAEQTLREDVPYLLLDEARILDEDLPADEGVLAASRCGHAAESAVRGNRKNDHARDCGPH
jgi:hypothetical protein